MSDRSASERSTTDDTADGTAADEASCDIPDVRTMTGLEHLRWLMSHPSAADAPSIRRLLGMRFDEIEPGHVVMSLETKPDFANPHGTVHGGIAATMLDSVMGCAVHTMLPAGVGYTTLEIKINYIRAAHLGGHRLIATGDTIHVGRRTATAHGQIHDDQGRLIAHGTTTCMVLPAAG